MQEPSLEELTEELQEIKTAMNDFFQNRAIWGVVSVILSLWLITYGAPAVFIGAGMFFAGTRWLKNHALAHISEHEMWIVASRIQEMSEEE